MFDDTWLCTRPRARDICDMSARDKQGWEKTFYCFLLTSKSDRIFFFFSVFYVRRRRACFFFLSDICCSSFLRVTLYCGRFFFFRGFHHAFKKKQQAGYSSLKQNIWHDLKIWILSHTLAELCSQTRYYGRITLTPLKTLNGVRFTSIVITVLRRVFVFFCFSVFLVHFVDEEGQKTLSRVIDFESSIRVLVIDCTSDKDWMDRYWCYVRLFMQSFDSIRGVIVIVNMAA